MQRYAIGHHIPPFFWLPRGAGRQPPTSVRRLVGFWLFVLACGAGLTALDWNDDFGGSHLMALLFLFHIVDDISDGIRHRWPAALAAVAVLWGASRLTSAVLPGSLDDAWARSVASAVGVTLGLAVSAAITRLPERRLHRSAGDTETTPGSAV
ncbi:hypothetical protein AB0933_13295 [Streptomyces venezuelae]|uniref:hypothetical protein n=1 Tax=Streptomyces venezuelae TaxID=54571 RepID=UPI003451C6D4